MKTINNGIVFSNDIERILNGFNALDFNYEQNKMIIPSSSKIAELRENFATTVNKIFANQTTIIDEKSMLESISYAINDVLGKYPIISLDKIYLSINNDSILFLDCTRLDGETEIVSRKNPNSLTDVDKQIKNISELLKSINATNIVLADDVVFTGSVLKSIINKFKNNGITVIGIRSCIARIDSYDYFNSTLPLGIKCGYLMEKNVIDQICERDFYFGIAGSGISIRKGQSIYKAPYFTPFGNPVERASIPREYEKEFSQSCIARSIMLWQEIEKLSKRKILIENLPEKIYKTNKNEEVIKILRKGMK